MSGLRDKSDEVCLTTKQSFAFKSDKLSWRIFSLGFLFFFFFFWPCVKSTVKDLFENGLINVHEKQKIFEIFDRSITF